MSTISIDKIIHGEYKISFSLENKNIHMINIIDFNIIKLLYELNKDLYEKIDLNIINDNEAVLLVINKHLFQDLGLSQKYSYFKIKKTVFENRNIIFDLEMITNENIIHLVPKNAERLPIKNAVINCKIIDPHTSDFVFHFKIDTELIELPEFIDKFLCNIFIKKFKRVKQFIENINM